MSEDEFRKTKEEEYVKMKSQWQAVLPSQRKRNRRLNEIFLRSMVSLSMASGGALLPGSDRLGSSATLYPRLNRFSSFLFFKLGWWARSVRKDVPRTDREWEIYQDPDGAALKMMHNVLMTYAMYNFDLGKLERSYYWSWFLSRLGFRHCDVFGSGVAHLSMSSCAHQLIGLFTFAFCFPTTTRICPRHERYCLRAHLRVWQ